MSKPILRWTIGNVHGSRGYEILNLSIQRILDLYADEFNYYVCYNCKSNPKLDLIQKKYPNVQFVKQKWENCALPILFTGDNVTYEKGQKVNGSLWKICPARLDINTHELILDNDLVFTKRPKLIEEFLAGNKNLIIRDSNFYMGRYADFFEENISGFNSGVMGLRPKYDFKEEILKTWHGDHHFDYGDEQGLLMATLIKEPCLIGDSEEFIGIHPDHVYLNCIPNDILSEEHKEIKTHDKNFQIGFNLDLLDILFYRGSVIHFLQSNRSLHHIAWDYFKQKNVKITTFV